MGTSGFFDYPIPPADGQEHAQQDEPMSGFLDDADEREWEALLSFTQTRNLYAGETVFAEGDTDQSFYLLTGGRLELSAGGERLAEIEAPSPLNVIAFLDRGVCPVTATALAESELVRLSFEAFEAMAVREPVLARKLLLDVGRIVARGLREA